MTDLNSVLDTTNHYQIDPARYYCPNTSSERHITKFKIQGLKSGQIKKWTLLLLSQFFMTRNFVAWPKKIPPLSMSLNRTLSFFSSNKKHCNSAHALLYIKAEKRQGLLTDF